MSRYESVWERKWRFLDAWDHTPGGAENFDAPLRSRLEIKYHNGSGKFDVTYAGGKAAIWPARLELTGTYPARWNKSDRLKKWESAGDYKAAVDKVVDEWVTDRRVMRLEGKSADGLHDIVMFWAGDAFESDAVGKEMLLVRIDGGPSQSGTGHSDPR